MTSSTDRPAKHFRDITPVARGIQARLLDHRKSLPHALNGRAASATAPDAKRIRNHMQQQLSMPVRSLLTVLADDLRCGVPLATVVAPLNEMIAFLELEADGLQSPPRDFSVLVRAETRAQGRFDLAELKALENPNCPETLDEMISAHASYQTASAALVKQAMQRLAILRGSFRRAIEVTR